MDFKKILILSLMTLPVLHACTGGASSFEGTAVSGKIVNLPSANMADEVIVQFRDGTVPEGVDAKPLFNTVPGKEAVEHRYGLDRWFVVTVPQGMAAESFAAALEADDNVVSIEYLSTFDRPYVSDSGMQVSEGVSLTKAFDVEPVTMNDPLFKNQWFLYNDGDKSEYGATTVAGTDVDIRDAWALCAGDPSVIVAIVDEGVRYDHPDLAANMWVNPGEIPGNGIDDDGNGYVDDIHGYNFAADGPVSWGLGGDEGHGTHVAGLVAAVNNNGVGISSVAGGSGKGDGVRLMSCQIFSGSNRNDNLAVARAIKYAADNGASVLQCSFGLGNYYSDKAFAEGLSAVKAAYDYFRDPANANCSAVDGNIVVISAGNSHQAKAEYPGAYRDYICVSAISQDNLPAWYTNYGTGVNIASPGGDNTLGKTMLSTLPGDSQPYGYMHGTSMATPVVSGITALGLSYAKQLGRHFTRDEFEAILLSSVNSLEPGLIGSKKTPSGTMDLTRFQGGKMGTGVIDAWKVLMNVKGVPYTTVKVGSEVGIDLMKYFGDDAESLTFTGVTVDALAKSSLGISAEPKIEGGVLKIRCEKAGSAIIEVKAIAGGSVLGTETEMGGKAFSRSISIVARNNVSSNGGWL